MPVDADDDPESRAAAQRAAAKDGGRAGEEPLWRKHGNAIIAGAVVLVIGFAGVLMVGNRSTQQREDLLEKSIMNAMYRGDPRFDTMTSKQRRDIYAGIHDSVKPSDRLKLYMGLIDKLSAKEMYEGKGDEFSRKEVYQGKADEFSRKEIYQGKADEFSRKEIYQGKGDELSRKEIYQGKGDGTPVPPAPPAPQDSGSSKYPRLSRVRVKDKEGDNWVEGTVVGEKAGRPLVATDGSGSGRGFTYAYVKGITGATPVPEKNMPKNHQLPGDLGGDRLW